MEGVGERLKALRKKHNYTQRQVADLLGISQSQVAKVETGERNLKLTQLQKLCNLYLVSEEYILYGEGEPPEMDLFKGNKKIDLNTVQRMNKIILNLSEMQKLYDKHYK